MEAMVDTAPPAPNFYDTRYSDPNNAFQWQLRSGYNEPAYWGQSWGGMGDEYDMQGMWNGMPTMYGPGHDWADYTPDAYYGYGSGYW